MPGVLTEIGFMSNPQEAAYMKSEKGQNEIARSLYQAVRDYSAYVVGTRMAEEEQVNALAKTVAPEPEPAKTVAEKPKEKPAKTVAEKPKTEPAKTVTEKPKPAEKPAQKPAVPPLRYTVQVMASASPVPVSSAQFRSYKGKVKQFTSEGRFPYKYGVGEYETRDAAQRKAAEVRKVFPGAFVVSCRGTQIVK